MSEALVRADEGERTVSEMLDDVDEPFARVTVEGVSAEQHRANLRLVAEVEDADGCLNCGDDTSGAAFCDFSCLKEWGSV